MRDVQQQAPLPAFPQTNGSGRLYQPKWEEQLLDMDRVYQYVAHRSWFRSIHQDALQLVTSTYRLGEPLRSRR